MNIHVLKCEVSDQAISDTSHDYLLNVFVISLFHYFTSILHNGNLKGKGNVTTQCILNERTRLA